MMLFKHSRLRASSDARTVKISHDGELPQLYRLCSEFGFAVLGLCENSATPKAFMLCEVGLVKTQTYDTPVSPKFTTLKALEQHMQEHGERIIQRYLFGSNGDSNVYFGDTTSAA